MEHVLITGGSRGDSVQQLTVFPVLGQSAPGVIPVFRQRQASDTR
ncbi:hypothetical protein HMPREF9689_05594 [Klebsiella oxytoca 10-5245]|nr:hypothetical protein HMPREF9689_05594 [Klebsiella oxytoca 10-5245]